MSAVVAAVGSALEGRIDFVGQKQADLFLQALIVTVAAGAFIAGAILNVHIYQVLGIFATGIALTALLVVPAWPFYRSNPTKWL
ncbi:hypothetical protein GQ42DRAFT_139885, partial [Ramicandelaber brevisporus]